MKDLLSGIPPLGEIEHWAGRGSFLLYVLEYYPWTNYVDFWQSEPTSEDQLQALNEGLLRAYGKSASSLEEEWLDFLRRHPTAQWETTFARVVKLDSIMTDLDGLFEKQQGQSRFNLQDFPRLAQKEFGLNFPHEPLGDDGLAVLDQQIGELEELTTAAKQLLQLSQEVEERLKEES